MTRSARFRMGRLDHVHIRVPDRAEAAAWYSDEALEAALASPEMGAAVDDAKIFLDMDRTYAVPASEATIIG